MSLELIAAMLAITAALGFYSWGVFGERMHGALTGKYVVLFWIGLVCDSTGTLIMTNMAQSSSAAMSGSSIHGLTGLLAIVLMLIHATWATFTYFRGSEASRKRFHTFSTMVWLVWLIPYIIGMMLGMPFLHLKMICIVGTSLAVVAILAFVLLRPKKMHAHA